MSDSYKLVFRGEVLEGQHPAVVRKRLAEAAGFGDAQLDKLFSGRPVVVKREADTATAARYQALFRKAGARLRVLPVETEDDAVASVPSAIDPGPSADAGSPAAAASGSSASGTFDVLPAGSDLLTQGERTAFVPRNVDTGALSLEGARFTMPDSDDSSAPPAPDVSHLSVAQVGAQLSDANLDTPAEVAAPDLDVAEVGADLGPGERPVEPAIDVSAVSFDVAPVGADLGERKGEPPPPAPDTSHLSME